MSAKSVFRLMSPVACAVLLASCGGDNSNTDVGTGAEPAAAAANEVTDTEGGSTAGGAGTSTSISGRVADGYIQGATVCVDLNNSDTCEADEPSALTGIGGSYNLAVPAGAQDKPIVADIPAEAIDEDTGVAIGKSLIFIAPADKPEFISPITTLVHQEQQNNPSLDIEEAEQAVKNLLGVNEEDVSLFEDYVAGGSDEAGSEEGQSNFRYLHDTARVVTSMMKEIESEVESAAVSDGIDVVGSEDTQRAIRDIVRRQLKELLPAIAREVATVIRGSENEATDQSSESSEVEGDEDFDPQRIALALKPELVERDVQAQIDAVIKRVDPVKADIRQVLIDGMYSLEVDCYDDEYRSEPEYTGVPEDTVMALDDESMRDCETFYRKFQLDAASNELVTSEYMLDIASGMWVEIIREEDGYSEYILVDGQWKVSDDSSSGQRAKVEFTAEGLGVLRGVESVVQFKAATRSLDAVSVKNHLLSEDTDVGLLELVQATDVFPSGAMIHTVSLKETVNPYVLFNEQPYDDNDDRYCADYFDNCNVIGNRSGDQFVALRSLTDMQEGALQGIELVSMYSGIGYGSRIKLEVDDTSDGTLPESGLVTWSFGYSSYVEVPGASVVDYVDPASGTTYRDDFYGTDECYAPDGILIDYLPGTSVPVDGQVINAAPDFPEIVTSPETPVTDEKLAVGEVEIRENAKDEDGERPVDVPYDETQFPFPENTSCIDPASQTGDFSGKAVVSRWKIVEVDGVRLIEIELPDEFRYDEAQTLILAEHDGFIRQGLRLGEVSIDRLATYNETAFTTLRAIVEKQDDSE